MTDHWNTPLGIAIRHDKMRAEADRLRQKADRLDAKADELAARFNKDTAEMAARFDEFMAQKRKP